MCKCAKEAAEDAADRIGREREVNLVQMNKQAEQIQIERPEHEVEYLTKAGRHSLLRTLERHGEGETR